MGIRINNNVASLKQNSDLQNSSESLQQALAKLSTGLKTQDSSQTSDSVAPPAVESLTYLPDGQPGIQHLPAPLQRRLERIERLA